MAIKMVTACLLLATSFCLSSECPVDTFSKSEFCRSVAGKNDSDRINLFIMLTPQQSSGAYTSFEDAKEWSKILFEKYDLRDCNNVRASTPPDSEIRWDYRLLSTTKVDAVSILREPFIAELSLLDHPPRCNNYDCPGPKYDGITCDSLLIKPSNSYFTVSISLMRLWHHPPCYHGERGGTQCPELEDDLPNRKLLRQWTIDLFSKYDLRKENSLEKAPTPSEEELFWDYGKYIATEETIFELIKETYVDKVTIWDQRNIPKPAGIKLKPQSELKYEGDLFDLIGRKVQGKIELKFKPR